MKIRIIKKNLDEAAQGFGGTHELEGFKIELLKDNGYTILFHNQGQKGWFNLDVSSEDCGFLMTHSQIEDPVNNSFGPFGYDLLIELGTLLGYWVGPSFAPSGVAQHDAKESESAINVWIYYDKKRKDLDKKLKPRCDGDGRMMTQFDIWKNLKMSTKQKNEQISALKYVYKKEPIFLSQLKIAGMLEGDEELISLIPENYIDSVFKKLKRFFSKFI